MYSMDAAYGTEALDWLFWSDAVYGAEEPDWMYWMDAPLCVGGGAD
jgi:hypothetical protein